MHHPLTNQEVARIRYAEVLREATRRPVPELPELPEEPKSQPPLLDWLSPAARLVQLLAPGVHARHATTPATTSR